MKHTNIYSLLEQHNYYKIYIRKNSWSGHKALITSFCYKPEKKHYGIGILKTPFYHQSNWDYNSGSAIWEFVDYWYDSNGQKQKIDIYKLEV